MIMKKFILTLTFVSFAAASVFSQLENETNELETSENKSESTAQDFNIDNNTTRDFNVGDRAISVSESDNATNISINRNNNQRNAPGFGGHLGGIGIGFNGLMTDYWSTALNPGDEYFDLNNSKSMAWSFTFSGFDIGITRRIGIVSGFGLTLNNYRFNNNNNITKDENGVIVPLYPASGIDYKKSKLHTGYANIPVLLEFQIPTSSISQRKPLIVSGGVIGSVKLWSRTKVVFNDGGRRKEKDNSDFNLNMLRWGATARVGGKNTQIYGTTYFTPMFEKGRGPEFYPFEIGMIFNPWN